MHTTQRQRSGPDLCLRVENLVPRSR